MDNPQYSLIIVDDEEKIVTGIASLFPWEELGFCVVGMFTEAREALKYLADHPVDVVLTDIEMPGMNGIEFVTRIREMGPEEVVFFSSYDRYEYLRAAIRVDAEDFLLKPVKYAQLLECFGRIREKLSERSDKGNRETVPESIVEQVDRYLEENYRTATLEELSERLNLSQSYLSRMFKEKSGLGFRELLLKKRMEKACELLADESYMMYDIAYFIGYDNPKNFSRAFHNYFGESPMDYRKRVLEDGK